MFNQMTAAATVRRIVSMVLTIWAACLAQLATATDKPNPADYPELAIDRMLPAIVADMKLTLPDPWSVRNLTICQPYHIKLENGRPVKWDVEMSFNARNTNGGYDGQSSYYAGFRDGRMQGHLIRSPFAGKKDGLDGLLASSALKRASKCTPVPDARLKSLIGD